MIVSKLPGRAIAISRYGLMRGVAGARAHPGRHARSGTPIGLHIPAGAGRSPEMRPGVGIAYDAELLAEAGRRSHVDNVSVNRS